MFSCKHMLSMPGILYRIVNDCFNSLSVSNGDFDLDRHLFATAVWLRAAQNTNGGVCDGFHFTRGWEPVSPSTTALCLSTYLRMAPLLDENEAQEQVHRMIGFLQVGQHEDGHFCQHSSLHVTSFENQVEETATVLRELLLVYQQISSNQVLSICSLAARWLLSAQETQRSSFSPMLLAHVACAFALFGRIFNENIYKEIASKYASMLFLSIEREEQIQDSERCFGLNISPDTIALAYRLIYQIGDSLDLSQYKAFACNAGEFLLRRFEIKRNLPIEVYVPASGEKKYNDIAGNIPLALLWLDIYREKKDMRFVNATLKLLAFIGDAQCLTSLCPPVFQGIPATYHIWSGRNAFKLSTVAAKYYFDGLLLSEQYIVEKSQNSKNASHHPGRAKLLPVQTKSIRKEKQISTKPIRIVVMTGYQSKTFSLLVDAFDEHGIAIDACVIVHPGRPNLHKALKPTNLFIKLLIRKHQSASDEAWYPGWAKSVSHSSQQTSSPMEYAARRNIPYREVRGTNSPEAVRVLKILQPDLGILTGMGIIREPLLSVPRIGFLNAHNGLLPFYRGMDAVGWAFLNDDPIGCSVHFLDQGVDTGEIIATQIIEMPVGSLNLKKVVKNVQIQLLLQATEYIIEHGERPKTYKQSDDGLQYYRMHPRLKTYVERKYNDRQGFSS